MYKEDWRFTKADAKSYELVDTDIEKKKKYIFQYDWGFLLLIAIIIICCRLNERFFYILIYFVPTILYVILISIYVLIFYLIYLTFKKYTYNI